jgi:hypothetical protein
MIYSDHILNPLEVIPMKVLTFNIVLGLFYLALISCSGGGGEGGKVSEGASALSGVAATGATIPNAEVKIYDADGILITTTTSPLGRYQVDMAGFKAPFLVSVITDDSTELISIAGLTDLNAGKDVNITPLTDAIVASAFKASEPDTILNNFKAEAKSDANELMDQVRKEKTKLKDKLKKIAGDTMEDPSFDLMNGTIVVGKGLDKLLDNLNIKIDKNDNDADIVIEQIDPISKAPIKDIFSKKPADPSYSELIPPEEQKAIETGLGKIIEEALEDLKSEESARKDITESLYNMSKVFSSFKDCAGSAILGDSARCGKEKLHQVIRDNLFHADFKENGFSRDTSSWTWFCDAQDGSEAKDVDSCNKIRLFEVMLRDIEILEIDLAKNEALILFSVFQNGAFNNREIHKVKKSGDGKWRFFGNQNNHDISIYISSTYRSIYDGTTKSTTDDYQTRLEISLKDPSPSGSGTLTIGEGENSTEIAFPDITGFSFTMDKAMVDKMKGLEKAVLEFDGGIRESFYIFQPLVLENSELAKKVVPEFKETPDSDEMDICRIHKSIVKILPKQNTFLDYFSVHLDMKDPASFQFGMNLAGKREAVFPSSFETDHKDSIISYAGFYLSANDALGRKFTREISCQNIEVSVDPLILSGVASSTGNIFVKGSGDLVVSTPVQSPYSVDVRQLQSPYLIKLEAGKTLLSIATKADIDAGKKINVTPLTNLIVLNLFGQKDPAQIFSNFQSLSANFTQQKLNEEKEKLINALITAEVLGEKGVLKDTSIDFFSDTLELDSNQGMDKLLKYLEVDTSQLLSSGLVILRSRDSDHELVKYNVETNTVIAEPPPITTGEALAEITSSFNSHVAGYNNKANSCSNFSPSGDCSKSALHAWIVSNLLHENLKDNGKNRDERAWYYLCPDDNAYSSENCQNFDMKPTQVKDIEIVSLDTANLEAFIKYSIHIDGIFPIKEISSVKKSSDGKWRFYGDRNNLSMDLELSSSHVTNFSGTPPESTTEEFKTAMYISNKEDRQIKNTTLTPINNDNLKNLMSDLLISDGSLNFKSTGTNEFALSSDMINAMSEIQKFELRYDEDGIDINGDNSTTSTGLVDTIYLFKPLDAQNAPDLFPIIDDNNEDLCKSYQTSFNVTAPTGTALGRFYLHAKADNDQELSSGTSAEGKSLIDMSSNFNNLPHSVNITDLYLSLDAGISTSQIFERKINCENVSILVPDLRTPVLLKGYAKTGLLDGGSIEVKGANSIVVGPVTVSASGFYSVDVKDLSAPFLIKYSADSNAYLSIATQLDVETPYNINVTPLTHSVLANIFDNKDANTIFTSYAGGIPELASKIATNEEALLTALIEANVLGENGIVHFTEIDLLKGALVPGAGDSYLTLLGYLLIDLQSASDAILFKIRDNPSFTLITDQFGPGNKTVNPRPIEVPPPEDLAWSKFPAGNWQIIEVDHDTYTMPTGGTGKSVAINFEYLPVGDTGIFGLIQQMGPDCDGGTATQDPSTGVITKSDNCDATGSFDLNNHNFHTMTANCNYKIVGVKSRLNAVQTFKEIKYGDFYRIDSIINETDKWKAVDYLEGGQWQVNESKTNNCFQCICGGAPCNAGCNYNDCSASDPNSPTTEEVGIVDCSDPLADQVYDLQEGPRTVNKIFVSLLEGATPPSIPSSITIDVEGGDVIALNGLTTAEASLEAHYDGYNQLKIQGKTHHRGSFNLSFSASNFEHINPVKSISAISDIKLNGQSTLPLHTQGSSFTKNGFYYLSFGNKDENGQEMCDQTFPKYSYLVFDIVTKKGYAIKSETCGTSPGDDKIFPLTVR